MSELKDMPKVIWIRGRTAYLSDCSVSSCNVSENTVVLAKDDPTCARYILADHAPQLLERVNKQQAALKAMRPLIAYLGEGEPNDQYDEMLGPKLPELLRMVDAAIDAGGGE